MMTEFEWDRITHGGREPYEEYQAKEATRLLEDYQLFPDGWVTNPRQMEFALKYLDLVVNARWVIHSAVTPGTFWIVESVGRLDNEFLTILLNGEDIRTPVSLAVRKNRKPDASSSIDGLVWEYGYKRMLHKRPEVIQTIIGDRDEVSRKPYDQEKWLGSSNLVVTGRKEIPMSAGCDSQAAGLIANAPPNAQGVDDKIADVRSGNAEHEDAATPDQKASDEPVTPPVTETAESLAEKRGWTKFMPRGEAYKMFPKSSSWCREQLAEWIENGNAKTKGQRGDVRFRITFLDEMGANFTP
ncbi:MAG: hypothetical protein ABGZ53_08580 [Fuerstiella sp.]